MHVPLPKKVSVRVPPYSQIVIGLCNAVMALCCIAYMEFVASVEEGTAVTGLPGGPENELATIGVRNVGPLRHVPP